jgi:DNA excision repair protein ERCC-2
MRFPYPMRKFQDEIVADIEGILETEGNLVLEAGLGSGKTVCALFPTLSYAIEHGKKVLYITRTNSQQKQVIHELRMLGVQGMGMQGRHNLCPIFRDSSDLSRGRPDELSKLCIDRKNAVLKGDSNACSFYNNSLKVDEEDIRRELEKIPTVEEFSAYCRKGRLCAYELTKQFLDECKLVVAPYIFFLRPVIRKSLLEWMNVEPKDLILIVDEAHNLEEYLRELLTAELSVNGLSLAGKEALEQGNEEVLDIFTTSDFCLLMSNLLRKFVNEYMREDDALLPRTALEDDLLLDVGTSKKLEQIIKNLIFQGEMIRELKRKRNELPRSHIFHLGAFLELWTKADDEGYVKLISDRKNPTLELYCLDTREATRVMRKCHATVHMSGTLKPLEQYRDSIGLPEDTLLRVYPSPFPPENKVIFYTDDVTTKYEEFRKRENIMLIRKHVESLSGLKRNTAIFFPSYDALDEFEDLRNSIGKKVFVETKGAGQEELIETINRFKTSRNSMFFGIIGGRLSEGIDFPDQELEVVVLVGIPYPKPSARQRALVLYYDLKFRKGWEYAVRAPTTRRMNQAIGRLIRREDDRGVAIILDRRAKGFGDEMNGLRRLRDGLSDIEGFFTRRLPSSS